MDLLWLLVLGLGAFAWRQADRITKLQHRITMLEQIDQARPQPIAPIAPVAAPQPAPEPVRKSTAPKPAPLVTPQPSFTRPAPPVAPPREEPELLLTTPMAPSPAEADDDVLVLSVAAPLSPKQPRMSVEKWLAEHGLAWLGGGAIALAGALLVGLMAQQQFFTPERRIIAATLFGLALIGAGEWARRAAQRSARGHPLAAALLAGAGAATLYAAAWAAHALYAFIDWPVAALALAACAALLLGLSFRHGEPLGALAIAAAFVTPILTSMPAWPSAALTLYLLAVAGAGFSIGALRRWIWLAGASMAGAYLWFAISLAMQAHVQAVLLLAVSALGACAVGRREGEGGGLIWREARSMLPSIGVAASAAFVLFDWAALGGSFNVTPTLFAPALAGIAIAALGALALRAGMIDGLAAALAVTALVLGPVLYAQLREAASPLDLNFYAWAMACAVSAGLAGLAASERAESRILLSIAGAVGALLLVLIATLTRPTWSGVEAWGALAAASALLIYAAHLPAIWAAREKREPNTDRAVWIWAASGAVALLLALEASAPMFWRPLAIAGAALGFALLYMWRSWNVWPQAGFVSAGLVLLHAFVGTTFVSGDGDALPWQTLLLLGASAGILYAAALVIRARTARQNGADGIATAALLVLILALFVFITWLSAGGVSTPLTSFADIGLRGLGLSAAGFLSIPRKDAKAGWIVRVRGHVLMGLGLLTALLGPAYLFHPWWGSYAEVLNGAPLFNMAAPALLAPAALALLAAARFYQQRRQIGRFYSIAGGLLIAVWVITEIRRAFHAPALNIGEVGLLEGASYGLAAALAAFIIASWSRRRSFKLGETPFTIDLAQSVNLVSLAALGVSALLLLIARHPWWGGHDGSQTDALATGLATLAQGAAMALAFGAARAMRGTSARRIGASIAILFGLSAGLAALRWLHHQSAMDDQAPMLGVEALFHALWPLLFGFAGAAATSRAARMKRLEHFAADIAPLWPAAIGIGLGLAAGGLWALFPPWWGAAPAHFTNLPIALTGLALYGVAAVFALQARRQKGLAGSRIFEIIAVVASIGFLFSAATLAVRYIFHGADMQTDLPDARFETWTFSAVWAVFGALVLMLGVLRGAPILRWAGLILLIGTALKVLLVDMDQLEDWVRIASLMVVGALFMLTTLAVRRFAPAPGEPQK